MHASRRKIWSDRFLDSRALSSFLSSRPNFFIAVELVVLILKGPLSTKLIPFPGRGSCDWPGSRGKKSWKKLWCGGHQPATCVAVHFVAGTASHQLVILASILLLKAYFEQWTLLYSTNGDPNWLSDFLILLPLFCFSVYRLSLFYLSVTCCSLWLAPRAHLPRFSGRGRMY